MDEHLNIKCRVQWDSLKEQVRNAVIYGDYYSLEVVKWSCPGGIPSLFENGAWNVKLIQSKVENVL